MVAWAAFHSILQFTHHKKGHQDYTKPKKTKTNRRNLYIDSKLNFAHNSWKMLTNGVSLFPIAMRICAIANFHIESNK